MKHGDVIKHDGEDGVVKWVGTHELFIQTLLGLHKVPKSKVRKNVSNKSNSN